MDTNFYDRQLLSGLIENNSATFLSSGNPALDFFFQVVPDTTAGIVTGLLSSAWTQDPLTALKLVALLHGVHDERSRAKNDRLRRWRQHQAPSMKKLGKGRKAQKVGTKEERIEGKISKLKSKTEKAAELRRSKRAELAKLAFERYNRDSNYWLLHDRISDLFSAMLASDAEQLKLGNLNKMVPFS
ncbi:uncharacterized protein A4U43_C07F2840 [Asparagus officinalis]|uniref:DUF2828 domain-containing protein n=1 Tax=Asparagus officinalis TaxID=4686 RepID=A0A5P1E8V1_ASPOF|nr:uncharacterized protein A4U43_C07F2840 [Asparagus officinalis]